MLNTYLELGNDFALLVKLVNNLPDYDYIVEYKNDGKIYGRYIDYKEFGKAEIRDTLIFNSRAKLIYSLEYE